ncbi:MAG: hypothetical protein G01um101477_34 [Candidatus Doudnabacteria bacterium Gr01-1014_77]|uniref:UbiA prenyltransferase n=1 Tax=Candidatus Doudnabacteria bacterium Gr01-1014_77 TaxID=2017133 RepID=A0A554JDZ8_9BACT|nr:MAG: hypothetical protein G01um101477_34 [Candidatus Doudnabacteria bacterium Gr01-1014_77]
MRPKQGIFAVLLALTSFRLTGTQNIVYMILVALTVFVMVGVIMVWNDYCDRDRDVLKDKTFVHNNPSRYLRFSIQLWCLAGVLSLGLLVFSWQAFALAVFMGLVGWLYSVTIIKIPLLPAFTVAMLSSAVIFYPACLPGGYSSELRYLAQMTFCLIFARELMSDIGDVDVDRGHKVTIPVMFGRDVATVSVVIALMALLVSVSRAAPVIGGALSVFLFVFIRQHVMIEFANGYKEGREMLDLMTLGTLLALLAFGEI